MRGKTTFWSSIIAGAVVGGLLSLINAEARQYSKKMLSYTGDAVKFYTTNPDVTVEKLKSSIESINELVSDNSKSAINALDQVENTVNKFLK